MIRVAHLIHSVGHGGPDTIVINWINACDRTRLDPYLLCFKDADTGREEQFVESAIRAGIKIHFIPWNRRKPFLQASRTVAEFVEHQRIDILHCYNTYSDITGVLVKWMTGVKIITTMWVWGHPGWKRALLQLAERMVLPFFDQVTAQSENARRATAQPGLPLERIKLLICGYTAPRVVFPEWERNQRRAQLGAAPEDVVLINIARFYPEKAHEVLVQAFRQIVDAFPCTHLWLAGTGPDEPKVAQLVRQHGLESRVSFLGFRTHLAELLALAEIQVHPSHVEGLPLAICCGMAAGLPIVATGVGGVPEVLEHERSGILVRPGRPAEFAHAVMDLMADPEKRHRLGAEALRFINEEYSLDAAVQGVQNVYQEMLAR